MNSNRNETAQQDAEVTKLIKDVETYKDMFQKTETRLSKKIKELTTEKKTLVSMDGPTEKLVLIYIANDLDRRKRKLKEKDEAF